MLQWHDYQVAARRTAAPILQGKDAAALAAIGLGLAGEAGEFADLAKKVFAHGHVVDAEHYAELIKELGDIFYYCAMALDYLGLSFDAVASVNVNKLKERYPDGFTSAASRARGEQVSSVRPAADGVLD